MATPSIYWAGTPNYTSGNYGIVALFPHWTCGGFDGSVATLQNPSRQASAHSVIEGGKVAQLVSENDSAWHCGNYYYNMRSISYELVGWSGHPPTYETLDTCARMMAQASRKYFGGAKLVLGENVYLHKWVSDTDCPGETDIDWLVRRANEYMDTKEWPLIMWPSNGGSNQKFKLEKKDGDFYVIRNVANKKVLDIHGAKLGGDVDLYEAKSTDNANQLWKLVKVDDFGMFEIQSKMNANYVLDVKNCSAADGAELCCWARNKQPNQRWHIMANGDGTYTIISNNKRKLVLDAQDGGK